MILTSVHTGISSALANGGPVGLLAGFAIVGLLVLPMMYSIGELNAFYDQNFAILGSRFVSKGFGATIAIAYIIVWIANITSEYTSLSAALQAYSPKVPTYGWFLIYWAILTAFQTLDVSWWGESEYVLGLMKLALLTGFYIFSIVYAAGGIKGHKPDNPFGNYPLRSGFKGIANSFVFAGVYVSGVEGVSILAGESRNPRKAIPVAIKSTVFRVFYVYFGLSIAYGITVAYNDPNLTSKDKILKSPMTIALTNAGWANSKYFVTTMVWITCFSSINTAIFFASRALFTWSKAGYGPKIFSKVNKKGIPYIAVHTVHVFGFLSILSYKSGSSVAYGYIVNVSGVATFIVWTGISAIHWRFRRAYVQRGLPLEDLPFKSPFFPWTNYLAIVLGVLLCLVQGWSCFVPFDYKTFIDAYILLPLFFVSWFCYDRFYFKEKLLISFEQMEFDSGRRPDLDDVALGNGKEMA